MTVAATPALSLRSLLGWGDWERVMSGLPEGRIILVPSGREALYLALTALGIREGDRVLLPSFLCSAVLAPVRELGAHAVYYSVGPDLSVDPGEVESLLQCDGAKAMVVIHFFGLPDPRLGELLELAASRGIPVVEDCAHALYGRWNGRPLGSWGHAAVFSLAKTLPVPGGGILRLRDTEEFPMEPPASAQGEVRGILRLMAYAIEARLPLSLRGRLLSSPHVRRAAYDRDAVRPVNTQKGMGRLTRRVFSSSSPSQIAELRRANFRYALTRICSLNPSNIRPIVSALPEGACPLGLPLLVEGDREALRGWLYRKGLLLPAMWEVLPDGVPLDRFPDARYLRDHILLIPVNQGLSHRQIDRMVASLVEWSRR